MKLAFILVLLTTPLLYAQGDVVDTSVDSGSPYEYEGRDPSVVIEQPVVINPEQNAAAKKNYEAMTAREVLVTYPTGKGVQNRIEKMDRNRICQKIEMGGTASYKCFIHVNKDPKKLYREMAAAELNLTMRDKATYSMMLDAAVKEKSTANGLCRRYVEVKPVNMRGPDKFTCYATDQ